MPIGTTGKVLRMFENPYDPITYNNAKGALVLQTAGYDCEAIQYTNAKVQLELENGNKVYTYLKNLENLKIGKQALKMILSREIILTRVYHGI